MTKSYDWWMSWAILAFPRRWRLAHGAEFLEVSRALAADSTRRPLLRELANTVRGGLVVRRRDRPRLKDRTMYRISADPVPVEWYGWMRDDLQRTFLGLRTTLRVLSPNLGLFGVLSIRSTNDSWATQAAPIIWIVIVASALALSERKARHFRTQITKKLGFDVMADDWEVRVPVSIPDFERWPTARTPIDSYALPIGIWSIVSGLGLVAGAALANDPTTIGPWSYQPDPNSPLSTIQVGTSALAILAVSLLISLVAYRIGMSRARQLPAFTVHPMTPGIAKRTLWWWTSAAGASALILGVAGVMPDQASVAVGAVLVVLGSLNLTLYKISAATSPQVGRAINATELLRGERPTGPAIARPSAEHSVDLSISSVDPNSNRT